MKRNNLFNNLQDLNKEKRQNDINNSFHFQLLSDEELCAALTELRKKAQPLALFSVLGYIAGIILFIIFPPLGFAGFISGVLLMIMRDGIIKKKKKLISNNIVRGALAEVMELKTYVPELALREEDVNQADLIPTWNRFNGSDYVQATYRGVNISFSDVLLRHETGSGKNKRVVTRFKGQWIIIELTKDIRSQLKLREKAKNEKKAKSDVMTEDIEFNNKFQILTNDPHNAFYILTPHFMDYIKNMKKRANARIYMAFMKRMNYNHVHIALHNTRDLFEPNLKYNLGKNQIPVIRGQIKSEIRYITGIIDELLLNDYLFEANQK